MATGSFGLTTTFVQSGGNLCNANTTASSNTLLLNNKSLNNPQHLSHLQNQTNITAFKAAAYPLNDQKMNFKKVPSLLQKTQMVERRLQSTSKTNFILEDCSSVEASNIANGISPIPEGPLNPNDIALISSAIDDDQPGSEEKDPSQFQNQLHQV